MCKFRRLETFKFPRNPMLLTICMALVTLEISMANVTLISGDHVVELTKKGNWTVESITKSYRPVCDNPDSAQGTVLNIDNKWAGSKHGNAELLDAQITVDGQYKPLIDGQSFIGESIEFNRRSVLGQAYELSSTMMINSSGYTEAIEFQGIDSSKNCEIFYGFLGSKSNRFEEYIFFQAGGKTLIQGCTDKNDNSTVSIKGIRGVAQYDPTTGDGIITVITDTDGLDFRSFIWDRPSDNKLYFRFLGAEGIASENNFYSITQQVVYFNALQDDWYEEASMIVRELAPNPEPATLLLLGVGAGLIRLKAGRKTKESIS